MELGDNLNYSSDWSSNALRMLVGRKAVLKVAYGEIETHYGRLVEERDQNRFPGVILYTDEHQKIRLINSLGEFDRYMALSVQGARPIKERESYRQWCLECNVNERLMESVLREDRPREYHRSDPMPEPPWFYEHKGGNRTGRKVKMFDGKVWNVEVYNHHLSEKELDLEARKLFGYGIRVDDNPDLRLNKISRKKPEEVYNFDGLQEFLNGPDGQPVEECKPDPELFNIDFYPIKYL